MTKIKFLIPEKFNRLCLLNASCGFTTVPVPYYLQCAIAHHCI